MKKLFKIAGMLVAFFCVAALAALLILHHLYPPEKIKSLVLEKLAADLHRQIRLSRVDLRLRGVSLRGLEVSEEPDFLAGTAFKAETVHITPELWALLHRRINITSVLLSDWECTVVHHLNGTWNFENRSFPIYPLPNGERVGVRGSPVEEMPSPGLSRKRERGKENQAGADGSLPVWSVGQIRFENGTLHYQDDAAHSKVTLNNIQISTKHLRPSGSFPFSFSMDYSGDYSGRPLDGRIELSGGVDLGGLDPSKMIVQWDSLKLRYLGLALESSGQVENLSAPKMSVKASLPKQNLAEKYSSQWPQWLPMAIPIEGEVSLRKTANLLGGKVNLQKSPNLIEISKSKPAQINWNSMRAQVHGWVRLKDKGSPDIHLEIKTGDIDLSDVESFVPANKKMNLKGRGNVEVLAAGPADAPALSGQANLSGVGLTYEGQSLSGLEASAKFTPQMITAQTRGTWNRGNFQVSLSARNYSSAPDIQLNGQLSELDLASLQKTASGSAAPSKPATASGPSTPAQGASAAIHTAGHFTIDKIVHPNFSAANTAFTWDLRNANLPSRITGSAKFSVGQGRFDDLQNVVTGQNGLVKALLLPITALQKVGEIAHIPLLPSFDRVNFKTITGDYAFQNGLMTIRESHMDSDVAYVTASGKADLGKETLDMHLATRLLVQGLSSPIGFQVRGTFSNPSVKPDVTSILKQPVVNQVLQQGTKLLQNLFK